MNENEKIYQEDNKNEILDLSSVLERIQKKEIGNIGLVFPKMYGGWYEFIQTTDIGKFLAKSNHYLFRDLYHGGSLKGAFIKLDDETFIQVYLTGSERSPKTGVYIEIFPVEQLKNRVHNAYYDPDRYVDLSKNFEQIFNLECFETIKGIKK